MRFDLTRLGSREFEHLSQSLALAELGAGISIFGSGSDGGREATFDGPVPIITQGGSWDGYGVIQAKYKETLSTPKEDASWLISEINHEMKGWRKRKESGRRIPKYYLVVTNVVLSPTEDVGGIDRVDDCLRRHALEFGFAGWSVWHYDTINALLAKHSTVRTSYASWVTPGDVISSLLDDKIADERELHDALLTYVAKELLRQRYANLGQAGSADDRNLALADIFVDLPYSSPTNAPSKEAEELLSTLITEANVKYNSPNNDDAEASSNRGDKYVLIGGPGQGKSTITQFLCQAYRTALLEDTKYSHQYDVSSACAKIKALMSRERIDMPRSRRWPVNIQLTRLADELARGETSSLLEHIAKLVSKRSLRAVTAQHLGRWLRAYPWIVILDGLDEVPASSNRAEVLSLINEFLVDATSANADVVVVATTRPQGYTAEFSPQHYRHLYMTPLDRRVALNYGQKLAIARHGDESDRKDLLVDRLGRAYDEPTTAKLMSSPLQVTILAVLLDRVGKAPKDRYTLFAEYYRVIYERELEKDSHASALLRDHRSNVDVIHAHVGLILQTRSERSGETNSTLPESQLRVIVRTRLEKEGHSGKELDELCHAIIIAATERLVFLVPLRAGEIGFEIRSLQEFWAAQGILTGSESEIASLLHQIAGSSHWRNVVLFTLGHIFAERESMRDTVTALVAEMNSYSPPYGLVQKTVLPGSRLAVDVLADGMVRAPIYMQALCDQAMLLLTCPLDPDVRRLPEAMPTSMVELLVDKLRVQTGVEYTTDPVTLCYVAALVSCRAGLPFAVRDRLRSNVELFYSDLTGPLQDELFEAACEANNAYLISITKERAIDARAEVVRHAFSHGFRAVPHASKAGSKPATQVEGWFAALYDFFQYPHGQHRIRLQGYKSIDLSCIFVDGGEAWASLLASEPPRRSWLYFVANFSVNPSVATLAAALRAAAPFRASVISGANWLPWILSAVALEYTDLSVAASDAERGELGSIDTWRKLEVEWEKGVELRFCARTLSQWRTDGQPFFPIITTAGVFTHSRLLRRELEQLAHEALESYSSLRGPSPTNNAAFAQWLLSFFGSGGFDRENLVLPPTQLIEVVRDTAGYGRFYPFRLTLLDDSREWQECLEEVGRSGRSFPMDVDEPALRNLTRWWLDDPSLWGIGRTLVQARSDAGILTPDQRFIEIWRDINAGERGSSMSIEAKAIAGVLAAAFSIPASKDEADELASYIFNAFPKASSLHRGIIDDIVPFYADTSQYLTARLIEDVRKNRFVRRHMLGRLITMYGSATSGILGRQDDVSGVPAGLAYLTKLH